MAMLSGPLVFLDIDTQRDFLEPDGALYVPGSEAILPRLARLTTFARDHQIPILATADAHTLDEPDPEPFPPHCLRGTPGHDRVESTRCGDTHILALDDKFTPPATPLPHLTLHKQKYDFFSHPEADRVITHYAQTNPTFVVYGVATDYCVRAAVEGLLARSLKVAIVTDAIRPVVPEAEPPLLTSWARQGALLTTTDVVCSNSPTLPPPCPDPVQSSS